MSGQSNGQGATHAPAVTTTSENQSHSTATEATVDVVKGFLETLGYRAEDRLAICYRSTSGDDLAHEHTTAADASDVVARHADGDVWFGVCPLREGRIGGRGRAADVAGIRALWADLDDKNFPGTPSQQRAAVQAVIDDLTAVLGARPAAVVPTGHGMHPWWALDPEDVLDFEPGSQRSDEVAALVRRFGRLVAHVAKRHGGSRDNVYDLARIMRAPGTVNRKPGLEPVPVTVTYPGGAALTLDGLELVLDEQGIEEGPARPATACGGEPGDGPTFADLDDEDQAAVRRYLDGTVRKMADVVGPAANWPSHHRDERGRGWQKLVADVAMRLGALERAGWTPQDFDGRAELGKVIPTAVAAAVDLVVEWGRQSGRGAPAAYPQTLKDSRAARRLGEATTSSGSAGSSASTATTPGERSSILDLLGQREISDGDLVDPFVTLHLDRLRYNSETAQWYLYNGVRWAATDEAAVIELSRLFAQQLMHELIPAGRSLKDGAKRLDANRIAAVVRLAKGHDAIRVRTAQLDADRHLLNCENGYVNLRTRELHEHDPDLLMTKTTGVCYVPGAQNPDLERVLADLDPTVRNYMQVKLGQAATGEPPEDNSVTLCHGIGANSKTALLLGAMAALGSGDGYARLISERAIMADTRGERHPTELTELIGVRLGVIEELPDRGNLSMERVKKITADEIEARRMRENTVRWPATHSLFLTSNHRPRVTETDNGSWRRLVAVDFPIRYVRTAAELGPPNVKLADVHLRSRLQRGRAQREATLAWLIDGAAEFYAAGGRMPEPPALVVTAKQAWRDSCDPLGRFLAAHVEAAPGWCIPGAELWRRHSDALVAEGHAQWSDQTFTERMTGQPLILSGAVEKKRTRITTEAEHPSRPRVSYHPSDALVIHEYADGQQIAAYVGLRWREGVSS